MSNWLNEIWNEIYFSLIIIGLILFLIALIITLIGFDPAGIAASSIATEIDSSIGTASERSLFAILKSLEASGVFIYILGSDLFVSISGFASKHRLINFKILV